MSLSVKNRAPRAFTLVELLVVVAIISLLIAILVPALSRAKQQAVNAVCLSNLRGWMQTTQEYAAEYDGNLPSAYWQWPTGPTTYFSNNTNAADSLTAYDMGYPVWGAQNASQIHKVYKTWLCPAATEPNDTVNGWPVHNYGFNSLVFQVNAPFQYPLAKISSFTNPASLIAMGDASQFTAAPFYGSTYFTCNQPPFYSNPNSPPPNPGGFVGVNGNADYINTGVPCGLRYRHFEGYGPQASTVMNAGFVDGHAESTLYNTLRWINTFAYKN